MNMLVLFVVLTAMKPAPTFMVLDTFKTIKECEDYKREFSKEIPEDKRNLLMCIPTLVDAKET